MEKIEIVNWINFNYGNDDDSGSGDGYGYGDGSGSGYGNDDGSGYGSSSGYGDGSGYGSRISFFNGFHIFLIDGMPTVCKHIKNNVMKASILNSDFSEDECYVVKSNGYFAHGKTLRDANNYLQKKIIGSMDIQSKINMFCENFEKGKEYSVKDFYNWHNLLTGSCEMGRINFANYKNIDLEKDEMTPEQFIDLTINSFGSAIIKQLKEFYL